MRIKTNELPPEIIVAIELTCEMIRAARGTMTAEYIGDAFDLLQARALKSLYDHQTNKEKLRVLK